MPCPSVLLGGVLLRAVVPPAVAPPATLHFSLLGAKAMLRLSVVLPEVVLLGAAGLPTAVLQAVLLVPLLVAIVLLRPVVPLGGVLPFAVVLLTAVLLATLCVPLPGVRAALRHPMVPPGVVLLGTAGGPGGAARGAAGPS